MHLGAILAVLTPAALRPALQKVGAQLLRQPSVAALALGGLVLVSLLLHGAIFPSLAIHAPPVHLVYDRRLG